MFKPAQSWEEFLLDKIPSGKQPTLADLQQRWEQYDLRDDPRFPDRKQSLRVPRGVADQNMYSAWLLEEMEKPEAEFFAQNILQPSKLIMLAMVPELRKLLAIDTANADFQTSIEMRVVRIEESLKATGLLMDGAQSGEVSNVG